MRDLETAGATLLEAQAAPGARRPNIGTWEEARKGGSASSWTASPSSTSPSSGS